MQNFNLNCTDKNGHIQKKISKTGFTGEVSFWVDSVFFIEENTDVKNLNKTNGGELLHILQDTL